MRTAAHIATSRIATAKADAAYSRILIHNLADQAAAPIDRITLQLAATFCQTAARHLAEAYAIVRDYKHEPLDADNEKGEHAHGTDL
jgi:hypothetical protein